MELRRLSYPADLEQLDTQFVQGVHCAARHDDVAVIATPVDFVGLTYYSPAIIGSSGPVHSYPVAANGWQQMYPQGLRDLLVRIHRNYKAPNIVVLENGVRRLECLAGAFPQRRRRPRA